MTCCLTTSIGLCSRLCCYVQSRAPSSPGSAGIRKLRWSGRGRGKRGGLRVIYFWYVSGGVVYMLYAYAKGIAADLTPAQLKVLRALVKEEFE